MKSELSKRAFFIAVLLLMLSLDTGGPIVPIGMLGFILWIYIGITELNDKSI